MKRQFTPETINQLADNEIFVFGSNASGFHVDGAAKVAVEYFGAVYGKSEGLQGQSYAIPTTFPDLDMIKPHVDKFIKFAKEHEELTFLVTTISCGNAGYMAYAIAPFFMDAYELKNVILPESFVNVIENHPRMTGNPLNSWNSNKDFLYPKISIENSILPKRDEIRKIFVRTFLNTVQIVNSGFYLTEDGKTVELHRDKRLTDGTTFYEKEFYVSNVPSLNEETFFEVTDKDCLKEAVRLSKEGFYPAVLNMANRQNPGGGVLGGSRAQEESIFRRTSLFTSLYQFAPYASEFGIKKSEFQYPLDPNYGGIYSPDVILFRDSEKYGCKLLDNPEYVSVITVAAMNRPEIDSKGRISSHLVEGVKNKMRTIFRIALRHRHDSLVLGAWGCGAFCNPPKHIASLFHEVLKEEEFKNKFRKIVFAIIEDHNSRKAHNPEGNFRPFQEEFCIKNASTEQYNLNRFLQAQENTYPYALQELKDGHKRSHWMWYIFPQLIGLGRSNMANHYGISGINEAKAYLDNPVLNRRLREVCEAILALETDDAREVFGGIDSRKLRSSMTLFDIVAPDDVFAGVLEKYFNGRRDSKSIKLIDKTNEII